MPKRGRPVIAILLSQQEQAQLEELVRRRRVAKAEAQRAQVILLSTEGCTGREIAQRVGVSEPTLVEPWSGHLKRAFRLGRNFLRGVHRGCAQRAAGLCRKQSPPMDARAFAAHFRACGLSCISSPYRRTSRAERFSGSTIYTRMNRRSRAGVLQRVFERLQREQILRIKIEAIALDSAIVKVHPAGWGVS